MQGLLLWFARCKRDYSPPAGRSGELFAQHLRQVQTRTDELLYYVLLIQYPAAIALALFWSPLAWVGSEKRRPFFTSGSRSFLAAFSPACPST